MFAGLLQSDQRRARSANAGFHHHLHQYGPRSTMRAPRGPALPGQLQQLRSQAISLSLLPHRGLLPLFPPPSPPRATSPGRDLISVAMLATFVSRRVSRAPGLSPRRCREIAPGWTSSPWQCPETPYRILSPKRPASLAFFSPSECSAADLIPSTVSRSLHRPGLTPRSCSPAGSGLCPLLILHSHEFGPVRAQTVRVPPKSPR